MFVIQIFTKIQVTAFWLDTAVGTGDE